MKLIKFSIPFIASFISFSSCTSQVIDCDIKTLNNQLIEMKEKEQSIRREVMPLIAQNQKDGSGGLKLFSLATKMNKIDEKNQKVLQGILNKCDWPGELSEDAHKSVFLILQHSPDSLMRKYYPMVKLRSETGSLLPDDPATMFDRLQMNARKPQRYGTQTFQKNNQNVIWPIQSIDSLELLRTSVGLPSMEAYFKLAKDSTGVEIVWDKTLKIEDISKQ